MLEDVSTESQLKLMFERGLDGDEAAYHKFLHAIGTLLRRYVARQLYRLKRTDVDAEDVVQEVLLAMHAKRHVYDRDAPITAWAHAIARYRMIDFLRATSRTAQNIALEEIEGLADVGGAEIDLALSLTEMIAALPERLRYPIELMKLMGFTAREAAAITNTSEASVKVNVHRGLKALVRTWGNRQ